MTKLLFALLLCASCAPMITGEDLQAYYGVPPHVSATASNGKGQWISFDLKDGGRDSYWLVSDTVKGYSNDRLLLKALQELGANTKF